jgi:predicted transcriptional regulator
MNEITINGLTARQKEMLEIMWNMEELEEVEEWISTLSLKEQKMCELLMQVVVLESYEDLLEVTSTKEANDLINRIKAKK